VIAIVNTSEPWPLTLVDGGVFPSSGGAARRVKNWPTDSVTEEDQIGFGSLLLAGRDADGGWWYAIGDGQSTDCWPIYGGSFDEGDSIWFSSGLRVPKAPDFAIHSFGDPAEAFPGHADDFVCVDAQGVARYIELFQAR
jgi:hypothetical protein